MGVGAFSGYTIKSKNFSRLTWVSWDVINLSGDQRTVIESGPSLER